MDKKTTQSRDTYIALPYHEGTTLWCSINVKYLTFFMPCLVRLKIGEPER